jgi:hypothetical protein
MKIRWWKHKIPIVGNPPWWFGWYWKRRCAAVEDRLDQMEAEIRRLKGCKPLSNDEIRAINEGRRNK